MGWFKFDEDYDYPVPGKRSWIAYKGGSTYNVPKDVEIAAIALGKGHLMARPRAKRNARRP